MKKENRISSGGLDCLVKTVYDGIGNVDPILVTKLLHSLTPRQHDILFLHFGLGDGNRRDLGTIAKMLGLTPRKTVDSYASIIRKLRHPSRVQEIIKGRKED
jgi:DNA-directed RNA polymerase sigma subunit (sigma70/sigma32)